MVEESPTITTTTIVVEVVKVVVVGDFVDEVGIGVGEELLMLPIMNLYIEL